jgi:serine protease Do
MRRAAVTFSCLLPLLLGSAGCAAPKAPVAHAAPRALTPAEIAAHGLPSVVTMRTSHSLGTGFVVRADGWIATNLHVISDGPHLKVTLRDGRDFEVVEVLAASTVHDLALVRIEAQGLPVLALGDSDAMRPGDPVVAIGNPLELEGTVSNGLVSARRKVKGDFDVLQVSAPIAPGSSGGPLFNDRGEVVGISTAVVRGEESLAFGVPVRYLAPMIAQPEPMPFSLFATIIAQMREARTPKVHRSVPHFPTSLLAGCSVDAQKLVVKTIGEAIEAGAPLYNAGKAAACYHVYDFAASDLGHKLPAACQGPIKALSDAQKRAAVLPDAVPQAWAMRDVFDGLLDVVVRRQDGSQDKSQAPPDE